MDDQENSIAADRRANIKRIVETLYGKQGRSEFARAIGVSPSTITMVLSGERDVTDKLELKLLRAMDQILIGKIFSIYRAIDIAEDIGNRVLPGANFKLAPLLTREEYDEELQAISRFGATKS